MFRKSGARHTGIEKMTVAAMIAIYCRGHHHALPCAGCDALKEYALKRLDKCPYENRKPACKHCPIHCYKPVMRERIREVMRYSGPRMLWRYPWLSVRHKLSRLFNKPKALINMKKQEEDLKFQGPKSNPDSYRDQNPKSKVQSSKSQ